MIRPTLLLLTIALTSATAADAPKVKSKVYEATVNQKDAKYTDTGKPLPPEDPELAKYYASEKTLPLPAVTAAVETKLPLVLK